MMKGYQKKLILLVLVTLVLTSCLVPVSMAKSNTVELRFAWWGSKARHDGTNEAIKLFMKKYPHIKVIGEPAGFDGYHDKLATQIAASSEPDVFQFANDQVFGDFADTGRLLNIKKFIGKEIDVKGIAPSVIKGGAYRGVLYGIPTGINGKVMLYNKKLFDDAKISYPKDNWTWADFDAALRKINAALPGTYGSIDFSLNDYCQFTFIQINQEGVQTVSEKMKVGNVKDSFKKTLEYFSKLRAEKLLPPADQTIVQNTQQNNWFGAGKAAMVPENLSTAAVQRGNLGDRGSVGIAMFPGSSKQPSGVYLYGNLPLMIGKSSKHQKEAAMLINFMVNDTEAAKVLKTVRGIPPSAKFRAVVLAEASDFDKEVFEAVEKFDKISDQKPDNYLFARGAGQQFYMIVREESEKVAFGLKTPEQAAQSIQERMNKSIADANRK